MPNLVATPAPLTDAQIAAAEALVAAEFGVASLQEQVNLGESGEIGSGGLIHLRMPATAIQTVFVAGNQILATLKTPWIVDVGASVRPYLSGGFFGTAYARLPYTITYTGGWNTDNLPEGIRQAILLTATALAASTGREGIKAESMGPASRTYQDYATQSTLGADALNLLRPWLPLRV